ncbi:MAG: Calx-beta domain-containing protein [Verrucomicrobiota bacterium]
MKIRWVLAGVIVSLLLLLLVPFRHQEPDQSPPPAAPAPVTLGDWTSQYCRAPAASPVTTGVTLARQHRERIKQLIQTDPQRALAEAVPFNERQKLPPAVVAELEQPVSGRGFYGVRVATDFENNRVEVKREAVIGGRRYEAFVYGRREAQKTSDNISLHGIAVDNVIALDENPARELAPTEVAARLAANEKSSGKCPISGLSIPATPDQPAVDVGGQLVFLCTGGHIHALNAELIAQEGSSGGGVHPGGTIQAGWTHGPRRILYMRVQFPDKLGDPQTEADCYTMLESLNQFYIENSYGDAYVIPTVTPLLTLPYTEQYYISISGDLQLLDDARTVASAAGYDTDQYEWDAVRYNGGPGSFGGQAYVGGKGCWMRTSSVGVSVHEHGHNFGLWHANSWTPTAESPIGPGTHVEYGNIFDTMGAAIAGIYHFNTEFKNELGWLPNSNVITVAESGMTNRIYAHDQAVRDTANRYALKIFKDYDRDYWVEFRQKFSSTPWVFNGVQLNWSPWTQSAGGTHLLDTTPGSPDGKNDGAVVVGRTFSDFGAGIHITPVAKVATTPAAMDVVVNLGFFTNNNPPTASVGASTTTVGVGVPVTLTATGADPDGDPLAYCWDFGDRTVGSNVAVAVKSWAAAGEYVARCVVSDMKGGTASDSIVIRVGSPATFQITGQIVADGLPLADARVFVTNSTTILTYSDTDGTYTLTGLGAGTFGVTAAKWGHVFATNSVTVGPNASSINFTSAPLPVITIETPDAVAAEGGDTGTVVIIRTGPTAAPLDVYYYRGGTAAYGSDYTNSPAPVGGSPYTITIPAGTNAVTLTLLPITSAGAEPLETAIFNLAAENKNYLVGSPGSAVVNIFDSLAPTAVLQTLESGITENGDADGLFMITLSTPAATSLVASYTITGTASNGLDYVALPGTVTIESNATTATIRITPLPDGITEGTETVIVGLTAVPGYTLGTPTNGVATISDDNATVVNLTVPDPNAAEAGPDLGQFLITRTGPTNAALRVYYSVGGTAIHGTDYLRLPGSVIIPAGETAAAVLITPVDDDIGEWNQTVILQLSSRSEYRLGPNRIGTVTIVDNDKPLVGVTAVDGYATETAGDTGQFLITRSGSQGGTITVNYTMTGTAINGVDYSSLSGTVTLGPSTTAPVTTTITVTPIDDALAEGDETVILNILPDPTYAVDIASNATISIRDNEVPTVSVTASNLVAFESSTTTTNRFYFWRSSTTGTLTVNYSVSGTASNGVDYTTLPGSVTFAAGSATAAASFTTIQDALAEGNEKIILSLLPDPAYGLSIANTAIMMLNDDDTNALKVNFAASSSSGSETNPTVDLLVRLTASSVNTVTVDYAFSSGSATGGGVDFNLAPGTLTFLPGNNSNYITVAILDDVRPEANETLTIQLSNPINAAIGTTNAHTYTIIDNDYPALPSANFLTTASTNSEAAGAVAVLVALDNIATNTVTVSIAGQAITFAPGETTHSFTTNLVNNNIPELTRTITLTITGAVNAVIGAPATHLMTVLDDDAVTLTWSGSIDTNWNTTTANWSGSTFTPSNLVRFVDAGITRSNVFIQSSVEPLSITISNATKTFTFFGGDITGSAPLIKDGTGTAVFSNYISSLTFTGGSMIRSGTVEFVTTTNNLTVGFGTGTNTLNGATFRFKASSVASGEVTTLTNPFNITTAGGTLSFARHANNPKIVFSGPVSLDRATFWIAGADANGGGGVDHHALTGQLTLTGTNLLRRITNHAGANFAIVGDIVDGVLPGTLVLSNSVDKLWRILGTNNTYSGGTIIGNDGVADSSRAIEVGTNTTLGTGDVTVRAGGYLRLLWPGNFATNALVNLDGTVFISANVTNQVGGLTLAGIAQPNGLYTSNNTASFIVGPGALQVGPFVTVTIAATDPTASEFGLNPGSFTISRTGDTATPLAVPFSLSGSASNGADYATLLSPATIPAASNSVIISVTPLPDAIAEGNEPVVLTLLADPAYSLGVPGNATVIIADLPADAWRVAQFGADANNPALAGDLADIDGDGLVNLLEYTLHLNPHVADAAGMPQPGTSAGFLTLTYTRCKPPTDVTYIVEAADTPAGPWTPVATEEVLTDDGTWQTVRAIDDVPVSNTAQRFLRVRVTRP